MTKADLLLALDAYDEDEPISESEIERIAREIDRERYEEHEAFIEMLEERQEKNGFYAFQDAMWNWRNER